MTKAKKQSYNTYKNPHAVKAEPKPSKFLFPKNAHYVSGFREVDEILKDFIPTGLNPEYEENDDAE